MLMRLRLGLVLVLVCASSGCGDDESPSADGDSTTGGEEALESSESTSTPGSDNELPTMEAVVDAAAACSQGDATALRFVATRIGCVRPPPAPCTLPDPPKQYAGTAVDCPSSDTALPLRVGVDQTGRYHVESVLVLEDGSERRDCHREGGEVEVIIDDGRLANRPTIEVSPSGQPCP